MPTIMPKPITHTLRNNGAGFCTPALKYAHTEPDNTIDSGIYVPLRGLVICLMFIVILLLFGLAVLPYPMIDIVRMFD